VINDVKGNIVSEIIENGSDLNGAAENILVGDGSAPVSLKVYQDVYHQINGRTEEIRKRYTENLLIEFDEVQQLHFKIMQLCDVHHVIANSETISIFHEKERKEQFTSFERFKLYNASSTSPSLNMVLKYNFSIIPGGMSRPQEYVISIRLNSRVAVMKQLEEDSPFMGGRFLAIFGNAVAEITVEYADYVVARGFVEAFDEWVNGCNTTPKSKWLFLLQGKSHYIPSVLKISIILIMAISAINSLHMFFSEGNNIERQTRFILFYGSAAYLAVLFSEMVGRIIESSIDSYPILSYLKLNRGDEKIIDEFCSRRKYVFLKFLSGVTFTIVISIVASKLEKLV
jgi:hypothetical protein